MSYHNGFIGTERTLCYAGPPINRSALGHVYLANWDTHRILEVTIRDTHEAIGW